MAAKRGVNDTCVYFHTRLDGIVFYVGIGSIKRSEDHRLRSSYWHRVTEKHGYTVTLLYTGLSWEAACVLEVELIAKYRELSGTRICNATLGG